MYSLRVVRNGRALEIETGIGRARLSFADEQFPPFEKVIPKRVDNGRSVVGLSSAFVSGALAAAAHAGEGAVLSLGESELDPMRLDVTKPVSGLLEAVYVLMPRRVDIEQKAEAAE
jgi:hypothetical protein